MLVKVIDVAKNGHETVRCEAFLGEVFPDADDPERAHAESELLRAGRYWTGGGAAPLVLLKRIAP
jgi:hypothetical protein